MNSVVSVKESSSIPTSRNYAVICSFFILGAVLGIMAVSSYGGSSFENNVLDGISLNGFFSLFLSVFKYHFISFAAGLLLFGFLVIPLISAVKGFFVSFTSYVYLLSCGFDFLSVSFIVLFLLQFISVVSMFFLMNSAMLFSYRLTATFFDSQVLKRIFTGTFLKVFFFVFFIILLLCFLIYSYYSGFHTWGDEYYA